MPGGAASLRSASVEGHQADRDCGVPHGSDWAEIGGAKMTRLRESGSGVLDVLAGEGRVLHGAASVSQHESQASRFSGGVLSGLWRGGESRGPPEKLR